MKALWHCTVALLAATIAVPAGAAAQELPEPGSATFLVFVQNRQVGTERVTLVRTSTGWTLRGSGRLAPPFDLITESFSVQYATDWQPVEMHIEGSLRGQPVTIETSFGLTTAITEITQNGNKSQKTDEMPARSVVLPNSFFGSYEALAARLPGLAEGDEVPGYIAPQGTVAIRVRATSSQMMQRPEGNLALTRYEVTLQNPSAPVEAEVWVDARHRLARLVVPSASLVVAREDVSSVMARVESVRNPGDVDVNVPANGFELAATLTRPADAKGKLPVVILVSGIGSQTRDEVVGDVPVFGQLAGVLADEGLAVVRYDHRGTGQSGGRAEAATVQDYADDVRAVVRYLRKRKDVDDRRIAVLGYGEGSAVALEAAAREKRISAIVLVAAMGTTGAARVLEQQQDALAGLKLTDAERASRIDLQKRILAAVETGKGWEGIPPDMRRQADSPWFRSFLLFSPARAFDDARQPVLIVRPAKDDEMPAHHADDLLTLAKVRRKAGPAQRVEAPDLTHRLVPAGAAGAARKVPASLGETIAAWLTTTGWAPK